MSVLNQSGEEQVECPLCMEPLEVDDLNFFPCTCGYQICRFCWHRIRTDENGLCPACRKAYAENPADFTPLSKEQVAQLKAEKRQRDQQRKAKLSESRKHLASVRVVQRNLVFVVGLPMRLADAETLKKHEYFGKFGKIHKVVINQSSAYAGTQGPSASAYVTYIKSDDALRAIQSVNNTTLDGKTMKTSLGTTKYCSHFMKNQACPKPDCMYLHDFGDQEASFTKEDMHAGKHQEYEKKLHDALVARQAAVPPGATPQAPTAGKTKDGVSWPQLEHKHEPPTKAAGKRGKKKASGAPPSMEAAASQRSKKLLAADVDVEAKRAPSEPTEAERAAPLDDNASFFTQSTFACCPSDEQPAGANGAHDPLLDINDSERWAFDFGYTNHSNHLEELATQRGACRPADAFGALEAFIDAPPSAASESLLEALTPAGGGYQLNGHKDDQPAGNAFPKIFDFYRNMLAPAPFVQPQPQYNHIHLGLVQQQQVEESLLNLTLRPAPPAAMFRPCVGAPAVRPAAPKMARPTIEDKDLDYRFQEAQKALEALVESDTHMHHTGLPSAGRKTLGTHQLNGLGHAQSGSHLPPPPPGFVQPSTHMNSFGSKILPYLSVNNQQHQQPVNSWPTSYSQGHQHQQQGQHKGMSVCNDWKILDPAILSSGRRIPSMGPLIEQYAPQPPAGIGGLSLPVGQSPQQAPRTYDLYALSNYSNRLQQSFGGTFNTLGQANLSWLGPELNAQISTPPGFRASGQATKQQEC